MPDSFGPTEQDGHPPRLPTYPVFPHSQYDFELMISGAKSTSIVGTQVGTDIYDSSLTSRKFVLAGLTCSAIVGCICVVAGAVTIATHGGAGITPVGINSHKEILALMLSIIITICTESSGFAHAISLRSALASESRLHFATNLRLLTAARGWSNPNGTLFNGIMAVLLVMSYSSASMIINFYGTVSFCVAGFPLTLLGTALLLQVIIALSGMRSVKILTWNSSPLDLTAALVHHTQLTPVPYQCMRAVSGLDMNRGPVKPSKIQPSAWLAHPSIRKVIIFLWGLVVACSGWAAAVAYFGPKYSSFSNNITLAETPWTFIPNEAAFVNSFMYFYPQSGGFTVLGWFQFCVMVMLVQGPLTLGLHCSELIANVIRDERYWRCATGRNGLTMAKSPPNLIGLVVFVGKAALHWMFSLSFIITGTAMDLELSALTVTMLTVQLINLTIALFIYASFFTLIALYRPCGPQPAAYGHLRTLANLIDEWSPVMWWGHKEDGIPYCHAGTSDHPLQPVQMDCVYSG